MKPINVSIFEASPNRAKRSLRWLLECILPCLLVFIAFQYFAYTFPVMLLEHYHIKGFDLHTSLDEQIPVVSWLVFFYSPSVITWIIMPFVVYGLYGRKRFYQYFASSIVYSILCAVLYIVLPTEAVLQRDQVMNHGFNKMNPDLSFADKMLFGTYQTAAPYGEAPSGHWGNSILFTFACAKPFKERQKRSVAKKTVFSVWTIFALFVCAATILLKQHNIVDGPITLVILITIWWCMSRSRLPYHMGRFFWVMNVKLGIEYATTPIPGLDYNKNWVVKNKNRGSWIICVVYVLAVVYVLLATWNCSLGGFLHARVLPMVYVGYTQPSYDDTGFPVASPPAFPTWNDQTWRGTWPVYWGQ